MSWAIWITGVPGSGTSAVARQLIRALDARGERVRLLGLERFRRIVTPTPHHTIEEDELVYRTLVWVAGQLVGAGVPVVIDAPGHRRAWRDLARATLGAFAEVELRSAHAVAAGRAHRLGHAPEELAPMPDLSGVGELYEAALAPELALDTGTMDLSAMVAAVLELALGYAGRAPARPRRFQRGWAIWLTGLPGSGKTTLADRLVDALERHGLMPRVLEYADVCDFTAGRRTVSPAAEDLLHRGLVVAAAELSDAGVRVVVDATAHRRAWRQLARDLIDHFAEVQLRAPSEVCADRERAVRWKLVACAQSVRPKAPPAEPDLVFGYEGSLAADLVLDTDVMDVHRATHELLGLVQRLERTAARARRGPEENPMRVRDLMTPDVITTSPETTVTEARALMAAKRIRHLLVTSGGLLAGIVTDRDIRLNLASPATSLSVWELNYLLARLTVREVMTTSVIVVDPNRDAAEAARLMLDHRIGALPVLDGDRLIGIVTETDVVRAFADIATPVTAAAR